jgi:hypothetical protein
MTDYEKNRDKYLQRAKKRYLLKREEILLNRKLARQKDKPVKESLSQAELTKRWREKNKEAVKKYNKEYKEKNKEKIKQQQKEYWKNNPDKMKEKNARNYEKHKQVRNYQNYQRKRKRLIEDPLFKLKETMRNRLRRMFKTTGIRKCKKSIDIFGADWPEIKLHIEKKFSQGMTWENHGKWHIDHIVPLVLAFSVEDVYRLCHYTNLQPLWAEDNLRKQASYISDESKKYFGDDDDYDDERYVDENPR